MQRLNEVMQYRSASSAAPLRVRGEIYLLRSEGLPRRFAPRNF